LPWAQQLQRPGGATTIGNIIAPIRNLSRTHAPFAPKLPSVEEPDSPAMT
jgi:hypothetical protein